VQIYENLVAMGFQKGAAAEALRQSNNDPNLALEVRLNTVKPLKKNFIGSCNYLWKVSVYEYVLGK